VQVAIHRIHPGELKKCTLDTKHTQLPPGSRSVERRLAPHLPIEDGVDSYLLHWSGRNGDVLGLTAILAGYGLFADAAADILALRVVVCLVTASQEHTSKEASGHEQQPAKGKKHKER
jgi:hypothetical protein